MVEFQGLDDLSSKSWMLNPEQYPPPQSGKGFPQSCRIENLGPFIPMRSNETRLLYCNWIQFGKLTLLTKQLLKGNRNDIRHTSGTFEEVMQTENTSFPYWSQIKVC